MIFSLNYRDTLLEGTSNITPQIYGNIKVIDKKRNVFYIPLGSTIAYPVTEDLYDKITSQLSIELYVAISASQAENPMKLMLSSMWGAGIALGEVVDETGAEKIFFRFHNGEYFINVGVEENHMTEKVNTGGTGCLIN